MKKIFIGCWIDREDKKRLGQILEAEDSYFARFIRQSIRAKFAENKKNVRAVDTGSAASINDVTTDQEVSP